MTVPMSAAVTPHTAPTGQGIPVWLKIALGIACSSLALIVISFLLVQLMRPTLMQVRRSARQTSCRAQVERIVQAIYAYRNDHGTFPPAYSLDTQQRPLHSWRVLILPYLGPEEQALFAQLDLETAWDSPDNIRFAQRVPWIYVCPDDQPFALGDTSYCAVVGDDYLFRPEQGRKQAELTDDLSSMLVIVEVHDSHINWMQPRDVIQTELALGINSGVTGSCGSRHAGGIALVGTADGRARAIADTIQPDALNEMATVGGNESPRVPFAD